MSIGELDLLHRAHQLFAEAPRLPPGNLDSVPPQQHSAADALPAGYHTAALSRRDALSAAHGVDGDFAAVLRTAHSDHGEAHRRTRAVLDAARADAAPPDNPIAHRELLRRRAARLRTQHGNVLAARRRARRRLLTLLALRYRDARRRRPPEPDSRAASAVRAALSRLGCPYVWGATGPDRFDCSGLVKWAYGQAGVGLHRTTYDQIHDGVPVARSDVRPGDLVFPHAGHVQMAIGHNLVVEAPHAGATVRVSPLGADVAIRRPV